MTVDLNAIKQLREKTGAGVMACKQALTASNGSLEQAMEWLKQNSQKKAEKLVDRSAEQGGVYALANADKSQAVLLEVNCETDFVARNSAFRAFVQQVADCVLQMNTVQHLEDVARLHLGTQTVQASCDQLSAELGERIHIRRLVHVIAPQGTQVGCYMHNNNRFAAVVVLEGGNEELARNLAIQVVANAPTFVSPKQIAPHILEEKRSQLLSEMSDTDKPQNILDKIIEGRLGKYFQEHSLVFQKYFFDEERTVEAVLSQHKAKIHSFSRLSLGEL